MSDKSKNLIWIDLEMTGLDTLRDEILEVATIVTDRELNILAKGPSIAIHHSDDILNQMNEWNTQQHKRSGLMQRVKDSQIDTQHAEKLTLEFLHDYAQAGQSPMCGNTICQDRRFLHRLMPSLERFFHYRNLDVSTVKELAHYWAPDLLKGFKKEGKHLALEDIRESIEELRYYRQHFFTLPETGQ